MSKELLQQDRQEDLFVGEHVLQGKVHDVDQQMVGDFDMMERVAAFLSIMEMGRDGEVEGKMMFWIQNVRLDVQIVVVDMVKELIVFVKGEDDVDEVRLKSDPKLISIRRLPENAPDEKFKLLINIDPLSNNC